MRHERQGAIFGLLAAAAFSVTAPISKVGYAAGINVVTLLTIRYWIAAVVFWAFIRATRAALPPRAALARGLLLGAVAQATQTWLFGSALVRIDASLGVLLLYTFPAMVTAGAVLLRRERLTLRRVVALVAATVGVALVVSGPQTGAVSTAGILLGLGAALVYTATILTSQAILRAMPPPVLAGAVATGAAGTFTVAGLASGSLRFDFAPGGWVAAVGLALFASVLATACSYAAISRIGPTVASILSTFEIPLAVIIAAILLGERLRPVQIAGGALVLAAVVLLQWRRGGPRRAAPVIADGDDRVPISVP